MRKFDMNGKPFEFPAYYLEPEEYVRIISEINTNYSLYEGKPLPLHSSASEEEPGVYYYYYFENRGYGDYNIIGKVSY